jgi:hypothetical protein
VLAGLRVPHNQELLEKYIPGQPLVPQGQPPVLLEHTPELLV